jgi:hypothetical protein
MLQAIAESTNPDVMALRSLLESDKEKSRALLEQKKQVVEKWTGICADLNNKKKSLQERIGEARAENSRLKEELLSVRTTCKAERDALSLIAMEEMRLEHAAALLLLRDQSQEGDKTARPENIGSMTNALKAALAKLLSAAENGQSVEIELMDVVRLLRSYLSFLRGIAYNASDPELAARACEAGELVGAAQQFLAVFANPSVGNISSLAQMVGAGMERAGQVCKLLEQKEVKSEALEDEKLHDEAEQQLRDAALRIEQAARQISAIRNAPRLHDFGISGQAVCEALLKVKQLQLGFLFLHRKQKIIGNGGSGCADWTSHYARNSCAKGAQSPRSRLGIQRRGLIFFFLEKQKQILCFFFVGSARKIS